MELDLILRRVRAWAILTGSAVHNWDEVQLDDSVWMPAYFPQNI